MSARRAFRKALKATIDAASLGVTVYGTGVPAAATFPFVEIGESDSTPDDADCIVGQEITMRIHIWGRNQGKIHPTELVLDQVYDAIHEADLSLDDPYACVNCRVSLTRCFIDPDGITAHGVLEVTGLIEDTS